MSFVNEILPHETRLVGHWIEADGRVVGDETCERIEWLTSNYLRKQAGGGWETLCRMDSDGRYWERTYPKGEMHGGGPPTLSVLNDERLGRSFRCYFRTRTKMKVCVRLEGSQRTALLSEPRDITLEIGTDSH